MSSNEKLKKKLHNVLKLGGFSVRREFCNRIIDKLLSEALELDDNTVFDRMVKDLSQSFETQCLSEQSIEEVHVQRAIEVCLHSGYDQHESIFNIINAFDFPRLQFNPDRKLYSISTNKSKLLVGAEQKAQLFIDRYQTILKRIKRYFHKKAILEENEGLKLQSVDYLLTLSKVTLNRTLILGCLLQVSEGNYYIEDPSGIVQLDLTHAKFHGGFFVENSFVLVNGQYEDRKLEVSTMILPPAEEYQDSRPFFGNINYFGGNSNVPLKDSPRLKEHLIKNQQEMIMFFSDVWLDHPLVFEKLETLFDGLQHSPPIAFVFMGNFMSESHGSELMEVLKKLFKKLGELIVKYPSLVTGSQFVFVPGLSDPSIPHMVPRLTLPNFVTADLQKLLPKAIFATNPCRLQYCTREVVIFRADLVAKLLQASLYKPNKDEISDFITNTIVCQGHLAPMSLNSLTVHWDFDHTLRLYPLPDLVIIGDKYEMYQGSQKNCTVANPGPFCDSNFQFIAYCPFSNTAEDCAL